MKPPPFDYHVPDSVEEACALKAEHGADAAILAGGQSLIPLMTSRRVSPRVLIDIKRIGELQEAGRDNGTLVLAAAVRQSRLIDDPDIGAAVPVLPEAALHIGLVETRHRGTVGGSLAHSDPVAELPVVAVGLGAEIVVRGNGGERTVPAADFVTGPRQTALGEDEIVVAVRIPVGAGAAFAEIARRHGDAAMASALARVELDGDGSVSAAALTLGAVAGRPQSLDVASALGGGEPTAERIEEASQAAADVVEEDPEADVDVGPTPHPPKIPLAYRRRLARAVAARALTTAIERARGGDAA